MDNLPRDDANEEVLASEFREEDLSAGKMKNNKIKIHKNQKNNQFKKHESHSYLLSYPIPSRIFQITKI